MTSHPTATEHSADVGMPTATSLHSWPGRSLCFANIAGAVVTLGFGALVLYASGAYQVRVGALPGPGMYPRIVGWGIVVLAALWLIRSIRERFALEADTEPAPDRAALVRGALSLAAIFAFAFALRPLGYLLSALTLVTALVVLAQGSRRKAIVTGIAFAVGSQLLVTVGLGIPLPLGVLEPLLR